MTTETNASPRRRTRRARSRVRVAVGVLALVAALASVGRGEEKIDNRDGQTAPPNAAPEGKVSTENASGGYKDDVDPMCHVSEFTGEDAREEFLYLLLGRSSATERMCRCFPTFSPALDESAPRADVRKVKKEPRAPPLLSLKEYKADLEEKVAQKQREKKLLKEQEEERKRREEAEEEERKRKERGDNVNDELDSTATNSTTVNATAKNETKKVEAEMKNAVETTADADEDAKEKFEPFDQPQTNNSLTTEDVAPTPAPTQISTAESPEDEAKPLGELVIKPEKLTDADRELYNYAASFNGAKIIASNKDSKHASAALKEDKDVYYISPCASDKFVTIELSEEVTITSVVLGNFEFHSSGVKEFEIWGTSGHHASEDAWKRIMIGRAENSRTDYQKFTVLSPSWVRYVQVKMIGHHEKQHFCTLSLLRVHGKDAKETLKEEMERLQAEVQEVESLLSDNEADEEVEEDATGNVSVGEHETKNVSQTADETRGGNGTDADGRGYKIPASRANMNATGDGTRREASLKEIPVDDTASVNASSAEANGTDTGAAVSNVTVPSTVNVTNATTVATSKPNIPSTSELAKGGGGGDANVFRLLAQKMKDLELNQSLLSRYVESLNARYGETLADFSREIDAIEESVANSTEDLDEATRRSKASSKTCDEAVARVSQTSEKIVAAAVNELNAYRRAVITRDTVLALALALTAGALVASKRSSGIMERFLSACSSFALLVIVVANIVLIVQNWLRESAIL